MTKPTDIAVMIIVIVFCLVIGLPIVSCNMSEGNTMESGWFEKHLPQEMTIIKKYNDIWYKVEIEGNEILMCVTSTFEVAMCKIN